LDGAERNNKDGGENYVIERFIFFTPHQMFCYWGDQSRVDNLGGEVKNTYERLVGNPKGKSQLGRPRRRRCGSIKAELKNM
jgi:hypothetical protein